MVGVPGNYRRVCKCQGCKESGCHFVQCMGRFSRHGNVSLMLGYGLQNGQGMDLRLQDISAQLFQQGLVIVHLVIAGSET